MPSYKTMWQEAQQEIARLNAAIVAITAEADNNLRIVDLAGIARHMRVERFTPQQWKQRDLLPPVDFPEIKGEPLWYASTIKNGFAIPTGRIWYDDFPPEELSPAA